MKQFHISHTYDLDLWQGGVYRTDSPTLAAICALLNPIRQKAAAALGMQKELLLSPRYVLFLFLREQSRVFLEEIAALPPDSDAFFARVQQPVRETFTPFDFFPLVAKYGLVPLSAMPDAACHHKNDCIYVLNNRLRLGAKQLADGTAAAEEVLRDVDAILTDGLGALPTQFRFSFIGTDGEVKTLENLTPQAFFASYCRTAPRDYDVCLDAALTPFDDRLLPVERERLKAAVIRQLQGGEQVVICADTRHQASQLLGILDTDFIDETDMFGTGAAMEKAAMQPYGVLQPTALLSLDGAALQNGKALRFKAQDVHGAETGADGHYTMSASWFDRYVLYAVINRKYRED